MVSIIVADPRDILTIPEMNSVLKCRDRVRRITYDTSVMGLR